MSGLHPDRSIATYHGPPISLGEWVARLPAASDGHTYLFRQVLVKKEWVDDAVMKIIGPPATAMTWLALVDTFLPPTIRFIVADDQNAAMEQYESEERTVISTPR